MNRSGNFNVLCSQASQTPNTQILDKIFTFLERGLVQDLTFIIKIIKKSKYIEKSVVFEDNKTALFYHQEYFFSSKFSFMIVVNMFVDYFFPVSWFYFKVDTINFTIKK